MNNLTVPQIISNYCLVEYVSSITAVKKISNEHECLCMFHEDSRPSMRLYAKNGKQRYKCFVCGSHGDIIDMVRNYNGCDNDKQAIDILTGRTEATPRKIKPVKIETVDIYSDFEPLPLPLNGIVPGRQYNVFNPKTKKIWRMEPVASYKYDDGYVVRIQFGKDKVTPTVRWCLQISTGLIGWCCYPFKQSNRKPYGAIKPIGTIVVVEGEKACEAGISTFKNRNDISVVTSSGGTNSVDKTDWSSLKGRKVIGIPDNDQPGHDYMFKISQKIEGMLFVIPNGKPKGWDIADETFTESGLFDWMASNFGQLRPSKQDKK